MIISHKHKFIFIAIPKTGTHSVRRILRPLLGKYDWEQCSLFEKKSFPHPHIKKIRHGHLTIHDANSLIQGDLWSSYFKFCFFRDPVERFKSFFRFYYKKQYPSPSEILDKMKDVLSNSEMMENHFLLKPQAHFLKIHESQNEINFIGRTEHLKDDMEILSTALSLDFSNINKVNSSHPSQVELDNETIALIHDLYNEDYELMNSCNLKSQPYLRI